MNKCHNINLGTQRKQVRPEKWLEIYGELIVFVSYETHSPLLGPVCRKHGRALKVHYYVLG